MPRKKETKHLQNDANNEKASTNPKTEIEKSDKPSISAASHKSCCANKTFYLLGIVFALALGMIIGKYNSSCGKPDFKMGDIIERDGKTWIAYNEPVVNLTVISDKECAACDPTQIVSKIKSLVPTVVSKFVDISSPEADNLIKTFNAKSIPFLIFDSNLEKVSSFSQISQAFDKKDNAYILNLSKIGAQPGKLLESPKVSENNPQKGPKDAPVTIIEYSDFQCPYCQRAEETARQVFDAYEGKVRIVFKQFPLSFHPNARNAANASLCANEEGKFWEMHDLLFKNQDKLSVDDLKKYAKQLRLDTKTFDSCLESNKYNSVIDADIADGTSFGISGTPAFFINDNFLGGAYPLEEFKKIIDKELETSK